ncbi:MAG: tRNA-5-methyluridine54 2-sulfurtransferase [Thermotogota bacterium]|nr:tRNA-5-methyluridine54 2-sulfurtransferase [Thermotogota bacterium]MDK2863848.1 tRNA-5-methyluridine54 2-sulfurtransferase [Thermotogota bacterium]HCZ07382.1 TIGR00269 family protein [Thermotogota bacterium]
MKCRKCGQRAVIKLRQHNLALCEEHFEEFFLNRVKKAIKDYRLFKRQDRLLIAVSGGKDSLTLWQVLSRLGYSVDGLHIDLGIEGYSAKSRKLTENFARNNGYRLIIVQAKEFLEGYTVPEASRILRRSPCSLCGLLKRYVMNRVGVEEGYDVLVTGHNMDDEAATLLGNILTWQEDYLKRQYPVLESTSEKFLKKVKPLVYLTEREVAAYAVLNGIDYIEEECPLSKGATSLEYKEVLNILESRHPGTKHRFLHEFLQKKPFGAPENLNLTNCSECGFPTTSTICSMCRTKRKLRGDFFDATPP